MTLRSKSGNRRTPRPFSTSEITHTPYRSRLVSQFSASESALNKIALKDIMAQSNLSSSTVEESTTTQTLESSGCSTNSLRRRKYKHKRRNTVCRRSHTGSADSLSSIVRRLDVQTLPRSPLRPSSAAVLASPHTVHNRWIKTTTECVSDTATVPRSSSTRNIVVEDRGGITSEPLPMVATNGVVSSSCSSDIEEEEIITKQRATVGSTTTARRLQQMHDKLLNVPAFRLGGPMRGAVTERDSTPIADTASTTEEQHSSFSEQAWDSYQVRLAQWFSF